ncbi:hypothetical protein [Clostridium beijerinckii]|uniref:Uncharacterized protein n=1 Tax=Clostridium beijerinckii TaxID=1520 RepID=A0AAE5H7R9_CLOBE|nr:hypothetical protein [Clostridium beijerinckii]NSB15947.1 hypothetical protein [Clostridium beijerinckii]OOM33276.1 hypothetical protein CLOBE_06140 [Clostridium beijerinckii]
MVVDLHLKNGVTSRLYFNDEEHKASWQGALMDMVVENAIDNYPEGQINAIARFGKEGKLNLE